MNGGDDGTRTRGLCRDVRNSLVTKVTQGEHEDAGFFDSSVFEAAEREGVEVLKRFLREGLPGGLSEEGGRG